MIAPPVSSTVPGPWLRSRAPLMQGGRKGREALTRVSGKQRSPVDARSEKRLNQGVGIGVVTNPFSHPVVPVLAAALSTAAFATTDHAARTAPRFGPTAAEPPARARSGAGAGGGGGAFGVGQVACAAVRPGAGSPAFGGAYGALGVCPPKLGVGRNPLDKGGQAGAARPGLGAGWARQGGAGTRTRALWAARGHRLAQRWRGGVAAEPAHAAPPCRSLGSRTTVGVCRCCLVLLGSFSG